ncbi:hypothetical protein A2415_01430 [candidate division WWE3 bacterium RIFOXYC1_FULL_39_7]|uniref:Uncharacterized protein n=2 Tax=Katanobacteria TaxID=422282 RepID=A0A1F4X6H3_UNCKA|nr:MAG: hypothetical protein A2415_01430 [candidate division WWE3 bacterium RIFOXYC1_FULL_39_7]OGC77262.1 MAG: hypothetical protein A2619_00630 [candidate division WWE3 bacterium RIFOXYD1_FULL_39_9]
MSKNKQKNKNDRRLIEIKKAQNKMYARETTAGNKPASEQKSEIGKYTAAGSEVHERFTLPVKEIKKDLIKNIIFAVFSIGVLFVLKETGFGVDWFHKFFRL